MFEQPLDGARRALSALKVSLLFNRALRNALAANNAILPTGFVSHPPYDEWRKLDHAVAVSQLYQIYESLIHDCISEWLDTLSKLVPYNDLSERMRATHRDGIGYILQNLGGRRFSSLSLRTLLKEYEDALSGVSTYKLHADAFLLHDRNLKVDELQRVVGGCGIELSLAEWFKNHPLTNKHDSFQLLETPSAEKAIASLVDLRNEASHATRQIGEIVGEDILVAYVNFIESLATVIVEGFSHEALKWHAKHGAWSAAGKINYVMPTNRKICIVPLASCTIKPGVSVYLKGKNYCTLAEIQEVQVNGQTVASQTIAINAVEIGLKLNVDAIKHGEVYLQTNIPMPIATIVAASEIELEDPETELENSELQPAEIDLAAGSAEVESAQ